MQGPERVAFVYSSIALYCKVLRNYFVVTIYIKQSICYNNPVIFLV